MNNTSHQENRYIKIKNHHVTSLALTCEDRVISTEVNLTILHYSLGH